MSKKLTGWIPCTTPPVRDGDYELQHVDDAASPFRAEFRAGDWLGVRPYNMGYLLNAVDAVGGYQWRGVRRWVLKATAENFLAKIVGNEDVYFTGMTRRRKPTFGAHFVAMGFDSEVDAHAYRLAHCISDVTAVLP
jgi:hypothetical protein